MNNKKNNLKYVKSFILILLAILIVIYMNFDLDNINHFEPYTFSCHNGKIKTLFFKGIVQTNNYTLEKGNSITPISNVKQYSYYTETSKEFREKILRGLNLNETKTLKNRNLYISGIYYYKKLLFFLNNHITSKFQKINRFFNYKEYISKSLLYINYKKMKAFFPDEYDYMLETYSFPEDKRIIEHKFKNYSFDNSSEDNYWLVKPKLLSLGMGIKLLKSYKSIKNHRDFYINKLLNNLHLINGYKYDIRFHGLVSSIKPLKLYLYDEGFVRLASEKYEFNNFKNKFSFITNIAINKNNEKYVFSKKQKDIESSNLWNLHTLKKYFLKNNLDYDKLFEEVKDIFIKMIFSVRKKLINRIDNSKLSPSNFYHLIGFDIILDDNLKPYLLEANRRGSMRDDNAAEAAYTHNIIVDTLNIVGLRAVEESKNNKEFDIEDNMCELERPRGMYHLVFPLKNNIEKYKKYYLYDIPSEDLELWTFLKIKND